MRSEPLGRARAACCEQLACVFASCGAVLLYPILFAFAPVPIVPFIVECLLVFFAMVSLSSFLHSGAHQIGCFMSHHLGLFSGTPSTTLSVALLSVTLVVVRTKSAVSCLTTWVVLNNLWQGTTSGKYASHRFSASCAAQPKGLLRLLSARANKRGAHHRSVAEVWQYHFF